jgi:copper(I)-binding protein
MRRLSLAAVLMAMPIASFAQQSDIKVENAWSRAAMAGRTGVVYLTITSAGAPDRLIGAASPVAAKAELHESFTDNGIAKMRDVATLPVVPGKPVTLSPGGYHIMLTNLKEPLNKGDTFPVTLSFQNSGQVTATVTVRNAGGSMPMGHDAMGGMNMPGRPMQDAGAAGKAPR